MSALAASTVDHVLAEMARQRERLVGQVVSESRGIPGYGSLEAGQLDDFAETVTEGFDAVVRAMADQRTFGHDDVAFLWAHIRRRTQAGVSEGDMLAVVRVFQRVLWDAIFQLAGDEDGARTAALVLARPLIDYVDALSRAVGEAFAEADQAMSLRAGAVRRELIDALISGVEPTAASKLSAARAAGLDRAQSIVVITARPVLPVGDAGSLPVAQLVLARAAADAVEPLAAVRGEEVVIVRAATEDQAPSLVASLDAARARLEERGVPLAIAVSTVHGRLSDVPSAYSEACLAHDELGAESRVLALCRLGVADYLILRAGDLTAWRLVPAEVRAFVEEDAATGGVLSDTLLSYVECDLSVKLAAERLFVHPNTAHYRLARIEERTHCSVRRLADVLLLTIAIRLHAAAR
jgi:hypothetical protein